MQGKRADRLQGVVQKVRIDLGLQCPQLVRFIGQFEPVFFQYKLGEPVYHLVKTLGQHSKFIIGSDVGFEFHCRFPLC